MVLISRTHYKVLRSKYKGTVRKRPSKVKLSVIYKGKLPKDWSMVEKTALGVVYDHKKFTNRVTIKPLPWKEVGERWIHQGFLVSKGHTYGAISKQVKVTTAREANKKALKYMGERVR